MCNRRRAGGRPPPVLVAVASGDVAWNDVCWSDVARSDGVALAICLLRRGPVPQRLDQCGYMSPVLGRELVDAGDQEVPFLVAWRLLPGRSAVVVVQSGGLGCGGTNRGDGHVEALGQCIDRGRAGRPGQVPRGREGVDGGAGQSAAPGDLTVGPAALTQPLQDQTLQRVDGVLQRNGGLRLGGRLSIPSRRL